MGIIVAIALEIALAVFIIWGILNEQKLIRFERAAAKAIIWELYERFAERDVVRIRIKDGMKLLPEAQKK